MMLKTGLATPDDLAWHQGLGGWQSIRSLAGVVIPGLGIQDTATTKATANRPAATPADAEAANASQSIKWADVGVKIAVGAGLVRGAISAYQHVSGSAVLLILIALAVLGSVNKNGARLFVLPGLLKITVASIPAKPKRKGINPFTKQKQWFAAKPASVRVKVRPLKKLKDAAA